MHPRSPVFKLGRAAHDSYWHAFGALLLACLRHDARSLIFCKRRGLLASSTAGNILATHELIGTGIPMSDFLPLYFNLAGPAILAALVVGPLSSLAFGGRSLRTMIVAVGYGVAAGIASALIQATLGVTNEYAPTIAAVAASAVGGYILRPKAPA